MIHFKQLFIIVLVTFVLSFFPTSVSAIDDCGPFGVPVVSGVGVKLPYGTPENTIVFDDEVDGVQTLEPQSEYYIGVYGNKWIEDTDKEYISPPQKSLNGKLTYVISALEAPEAMTDSTGFNFHHVFLRKKNQSWSDDICYAGSYETPPIKPSCPPGILYVYQIRDIQGEGSKECYATPGMCIDENKDVYVKVQKLGNEYALYNTTIRLEGTAKGIGVVSDQYIDTYLKQAGTYNATFRFNEIGEHKIEARPVAITYRFPGCSNTFSVTSSCDNRPQNCGSKEDAGNGSGTAKIRELCESVPEGTLRKTCTDCVVTNKGAWTAIGCIQTDPKVFIKQLLGFAVGIAGGIAFLMIIFGGFQIITSSGDPEKMNAGKELVGAAIGGLLFIIFSLFILRLVGVSILGIPGFK